MKRFLALMVLVVSLVTLAAPVFAYPPVFENNNSEDDELCGDLISIGFACPTCTSALIHCLAVIGFSSATCERKSVMIKSNLFSSFTTTKSFIYGTLNISIVLIQIHDAGVKSPIVVP